MIHLHIEVPAIGCNGEEARRFLGGVSFGKFYAWVKTGKINKAGRDWYLYQDLVAFANTLSAQPEVEVVDMTHALPNPKTRPKAGKGGVFVTPTD